MIESSAIATRYNCKSLDAWHLMVLFRFTFFQPGVSGLS
jgi:hypothetical protein